MILLSLVGEQPIPSLLVSRHLRPERTVLVCTTDTDPVARRLQRLIGAADLVRVQPYNLRATYNAMQRAIGDAPDVVFNLTGGTKPMSLAAFALAEGRRGPFVYLQSQGPTSLLFRYGFDGDLPELAGQETLPPLITAADYLHAHLPGYREAGFSRAADGELTDGGRFERAVYEALVHRGFEALTGVRPEGVANQIEIDVVIRAGNQVGIAEVKLGDRTGEGPKAGLDQLAMAAGREYLGTYVAKFLVTARRLPPAVETLATARGIRTIALPGYRDGRPLNRADADLLESGLRQRLGAEGKIA